MENPPPTEKRSHPYCKDEHASHGPCVSCHEQTSSYCKGCGNYEEVDGTVFKTFLCSVPCQKAHWKEHRTTCRLIQLSKKMHRAGQILKAIFLLITEWTFEADIAKVEERDGQIHVYEQGYRDCTKDVGKVGGTLSAEVREAVLLYSHCQEAVLFTHALLAELIKGLFFDIEQHTYGIKPPQRVVWHEMPSGDIGSPALRHNVLFVSASPERDRGFVFDLSAPQYGHKHVVYPLKFWEDMWAERPALRFATPLEEIRRSYWDEHEMIVGYKGVEVLMQSATKLRHAKAIEGMVHKWLERQGIKFGELLTMEVHGLEEKMATLRACLDTELEVFCREAEEARLLERWDAELIEKLTEP